MARTARYSALPASDVPTYEVVIEGKDPKGKEFREVVNVPKLSDLQSAMQVFGGETGPSNFGDEPAKPSLLSFLQDAIEDFATKGAKARKAVFVKGPDRIIDGLVKKMVKAGIDEGTAREFARKQILGDAA